MSYDIEIMPEAKKDLKKFDAEMQRRFFKKIEKLKEYPDIYGKPLRWPLVGKWELRFEKRWRIIYVIIEKEKLVQIDTILHKDDF
ncbi:MAG: type II toxin-antitoxin system RelE/ParE family toxin [Candidatus Aenigmatarchaeota archaeon]